MEQSSPPSPPSPLNSIPLQDDRTAREIIARLSISAWAFAALAAALEERLLDPLTEPCGVADLSRRSGLAAPLVEGLLDPLVALDLLARSGDAYHAKPDLAPLLRPPLRDSLRADLRTTYLQTRQLIDAARAGTLAPGWSHTDPDLLAAQGQGSTGAPVARQWAETVFPRLDGLVDRLQGPGAAFLDVGTGVGTIALEMCRLYPTLRVVGLEPHAAALDLARRYVAAELEQRIELRAHRVEEVRDRDTFDLAWLPGMFLSQATLQRGLEAVRGALRPGGWLLLLAVGIPGMDLDAAYWRLRTVLWGGDPLAPERVAALVAAAEFGDVRILPTGPVNAPRLIVARRP